MDRDLSRPCVSTSEILEPMATPASRNRAILFTFSCFFLLLLSSPCTGASNYGGTAEERFIRCFSYRHPSESSNVLYIKNSTAYITLYRSDIRNNRFLFAPKVRPDIIVAPTTESHVQTSVICARASGLGLRARSGGHDYEGMSYVSDGDQFAIVDLINLRNVTVDIREGTAWVGAGATVGEVYYSIAKVSDNLAFPAGVCPSIGVGGHFTGGGAGMILRKYGTSADHIVDAWLVDARGNLLNRESMGEDLFWAIRGGGGASFGIVLSYQLKLAYVPSKVTVFTVTKTLNQGATGLVNKWQNVAHKLDENLTIRVIIQGINDARAPGGRNVQLQFNALFLGTRDELLPLVQRSFPELGLQASDCIEMRWVESTVYANAGVTGQPLEALLDRGPDLITSFKSMSDFAREPIPEAGWESLWRYVMEGRDEPLILVLDPFGGRMDHIPETAIPFPHRAGNLFMLHYLMRWPENATTTQTHLDWMKGLHTLMTPYVSKNPRAAYLNFKDINLGRRQEGAGAFAAAKASYGSSYFKHNFRRLAYVKLRVDRRNFFRNEQSIPPLV